MKIKKSDADYLKSLKIDTVYVDCDVRFDAYGKIHHTGIDVTFKNCVGRYGLFEGGLFYN